MTWPKLLTVVKVFHVNVKYIHNSGLDPKAEEPGLKLGARACPQLPIEWYCKHCNLFSLAPINCNVRWFVYGYSGWQISQETLSSHSPRILG